ncbi:site-specific DNA-methyltransferase [Sphingobium sp. TB-6]|uniref:site-specific DNA-methyltransferase n=1 Tax=Sphingobium sp. TB-6 TaxID=2728850 RepID=UPI001469E699|nr:site-specific DNA-methyltransferase [Sphingobium sp. TB-6]NML89168.1 site-specific DNA-methyltransferase [Sphingobium sp. TB-6]
MPELKKLVLDDPATKSADIVAGNVDSLKALFPDAFKDGGIDFDVLRQLLGGAVDEKDEKYGLNWHGKRKARQIALTPSTGTLLPCPDESVDWDNTQNLMIEGDNLEVLKLLQKSYAGKVKLIYIDPPYNTGKDFVYPDDYQDSIKNYLSLTGQIDEGGQKVSSNTESSGRFHTDWLNMMYPRLKTARSLLRADGLIFISIDESEVHNLRGVCDEIFGPECLVGCISRATGTPTGGGNKALVGEIDYIVVYSRSPDAKIEGVNFTEEDAKIYDKEDDQGRYLTRTLRRTGGEDRREDRPSMFYPLTAPDETVVYPIAPAGYESRWICGLDRFNEMVEEGLIEWAKAKKGNSYEWQPYQKFYLEGRLKQPSNFWSKLEGNKKASRDLKALFDGEKVFTFPKPVGLLQHVIELSALEDGDIVLDFFAGSGTSAHATLAQNAADGRKRRYMLVQLPEPLDASNKDQKVAADFCKRIEKPQNIAELTKERLRRTAARLKADAPGLAGDLGFRVYKLETSNLVSWDPNPTALEDTLLASTEHLVAGRTEQDVLYELLLKLGLDLCVPIEKKDIAGKAVHSIGGGALIVCLADGLTKDTVETLANGIVAWRKELAPAVDTRVVFKDSGFVDDVAKANMAAVLNQNGILDVRSL